MFGSEFCTIPDPNFFHPGSRIMGQKVSGSLIRIRIKEFKYFKPKKLFLSFQIRNVHPGSGSWFFTPLGSRGQNDTGAATLIANDSRWYGIVTRINFLFYGCIYFFSSLFFGAKTCLSLAYLCRATGLWRISWAFLSRTWRMSASSSWATRSASSSACGEFGN